MKCRVPTLKIAAAASSFVLIAVYVGCKSFSSGPPAAGATSGAAEPVADKQMLPGSKSMEIITPTTPDEKPREYFAGSKSAPIVRPATPAPASPPPAEPASEPPKKSPNSDPH